MHSKYVITDVTYPNPNVFYELGIRHAISRRTILIEERGKEYIPFDIAHLRYIEYTYDNEGMHQLAERLKQQFAFYIKNPEKPDNQFLELCQFTNFIPDVFQNKRGGQFAAMSNFLRIVLGSPSYLTALKNVSEEEQEQALLSELAKSDEMREAAIKLMLSDDVADS